MVCFLRNRPLGHLGFYCLRLVDLSGEKDSRLKVNWICVAMLPKQRVQSCVGFT